MSIDTRGFETWYDEKEDELRKEYEERDCKNPSFESWVWEKYCEIGPDDEV